MSLGIFGFRALWSPYYLLVLVLITILYFLLTGPYRTKFSNTEPATVKQQLFFVIGMALLYSCKGSPLDLLSHIAFSAHMIQMALLFLVVPPLLILGIPHWLLRLMVNNKYVKPIVKLFTNPLIALILFNGVFSFYHIPLIFDFVKTNTLIHAFTVTLIFITSLMMWWPLINPLTEWQKLSGLKKVGYVFADGVLITPACALIIFAEVPLFETYTNPTAWVNALQLCVPADMLSNLSLLGPEMFNTLPVLEDQRLGGVIMKIIQEIVYGTILGIIFFEWVRKEKEQEQNDLDSIGNPQPVK